MRTKRCGSCHPPQLNSGQPGEGGKKFRQPGRAELLEASGFSPVPREACRASSWATRRAEGRLRTDAWLVSERRQGGWSSPQQGPLLGDRWWDGALSPGGAVQGGVSCKGHTGGWGSRWAGSAGKPDFRGEREGSAVWRAQYRCVGLCPYVCVSGHFALTRRGRREHVGGPRSCVPKREQPHSDRFSGRGLSILGLQCEARQDQGSDNKKDDWSLERSSPWILRVRVS